MRPESALKLSQWCWQWRQVTAVPKVEVCERARMISEKMGDPKRQKANRWKSRGNGVIGQNQLLDSSRGSSKDVHAHARQNRDCKPTLRSRSKYDRRDRHCDCSTPGKDHGSVGAFRDAGFDRSSIAGY